MGKLPVCQSDQRIEPCGQSARSWLQRWWRAYRVAKYHGKGADLRGAMLLWAPLRGADLEGANLEYAHLAGARLAGANLQHANLRRANLAGAHLEGTNLD